MSLTVDHNASHTVRTQPGTPATATGSAASATGQSGAPTTDDVKKPAGDDVAQATRDMVQGIESAIARGLHSLFGSDNKLEPSSLEAGIKNGCGRGGKCKPQRAFAAQATPGDTA